MIHGLLGGTARVLVLGLVTLGLGLAGGAAGANAAEIGAVRDIVALAYGTPPKGERHEMALLEPVVSDQRLETIAGGGLHVRFLDETDLWLDADSDVVLDEMVFDEARSAGRFVLELGPGLFRMVTGLLPHESYTVRTPVALIGVRGTDFAVAVAENGATRVTVYSGEVTVAPRGGGPATPVSPAETASIASVNASVDVSTSAPPVAPPTLSVDATADSSVSVESFSVDAIGDDAAVSDAAAAVAGTTDSVSADGDASSDAGAASGFSADVGSADAAAAPGGNAAASSGGSAVGAVGTAASAGNAKGGSDSSVGATSGGSSAVGVGDAGTSDSAQ